jgi:hypothetical protein
MKTITKEADLVLVIAALGVIYYFLWKAYYPLRKAEMEAKK